MNNTSAPQGVTRRSFIKRSVVASVAISSMTVFTGLVNAADVRDYTGKNCPNICTWGGGNKILGVSKADCYRNGKVVCQCLWTAGKSSGSIGDYWACL
jgi:hypothetical protein